MLSLKKSHVVIAGILGGLAIANQDTIVPMLQRLQGSRAAHSQSSVKQELIASNQESPCDTQVTSGWKSELETTPVSSPWHSNSSLPGPMHAPGPTNESVARNAKLVSSQSDLAGRSSLGQGTTIRIASFNMQAFGETKLRKVAVMETICRMMRQFDVVALQHIQSRQQNILPELIDKINMGDRRYDYCIGPRVGSEGNLQQFAFVFDTDRVETDRNQLYTVEDPQSLMEFEPLVGWFRSKLVPVEQAFTFSLVSLRIDPLNSQAEKKLLPALIRSVRQDGRAEDDVILAGDFGCSDEELSPLKNIGMLFALEGTPTTVTGESMLDNIVFAARATDEFTGKAGVVDFLRQLNLSIDQAFQISSHMPVWAEFFATEGGTPGYIGKRTAP